VYFERCIPQACHQGGLEDMGLRLSDMVQHTILETGSDEQSLIIF
jgi:hypothetical protein